MLDSLFISSLSWLTWSPAQQLLKIYGSLILDRCTRRHPQYSLRHLLLPNQVRQWWHLNQRYCDISLIFLILKFKTKIISSQYAIPNIPTFVSHSYQTQNLQKFVQSAFSAAAEGGIGRIRSANKRPSKPVPDEKKDEVKFKIFCSKNFFLSGL